MSRTSNQRLLTESVVGRCEQGQGHERTREHEQEQEQKQKQNGDGHQDQTETRTPAWVGAWLAAIDAADATQPHELTVGVENLAAGGAVPDELQEVDAPVVEMGTGTALHAPNLRSGQPVSERACSRGQQIGTGTITEYEHLSGWRDGCRAPICRTYLQGLAAAGLIASEPVQVGGDGR